ncbi:hypothetical protein AABB24_012881 [Solanum stoloniferum]|uniref:Uncharacterized protein n=1 Tax=Solanum stoloniferum TaxID=62892 RepID=A0ABD2U8F6_9SOLN
MDDEVILKNYSDDSDNISLTETAEPPSDLILPLLRHQKERLAWSLKQEESTFKGGILADEMGMGKTVQAIALVLAQCKLKIDSSILSSSPSTSQELPTVKGTLVVCPVIGALQWFREIERCTTKDSNKTLLYHGTNRGKFTNNLEEYDFVITTYSTIQADYMPKKSKQNSKNSKLCDEGSSDNSVSVGEDVSRRKSVLHSVKWDHIILDEAHHIKSVSTPTTKAVLALESFYKWALTGTPLQNHIGELYSLCRPGPYRHARHFLWWKKYIENPLANTRYMYERIHGDAMVLLKHKILKSLMLRRTKKERVADLSLPTKTVIMRKDSLDVNEFNYYKSLHNISREQLDRYVEDGTLMNNYGHIFSMIARLRQAADHRYLVMYSRKELASGNKKAGDVEQLCGLCHDAVEDPVLSGINCIQLVGSMSIAARDATDSKFTEDSDCRILLMSLKARGVALNLTVASHVFLMDPWWNPAVEQQAQDRIHRIGQYKPVKVVRFMMENTIEENIIELQEKKKLLFEGTVGGSSEALGKLTEEDLKILFHCRI